MPNVMLSPLRNFIKTRICELVWLAKKNYHVAALQLEKILFIMLLYKWRFNTEGKREQMHSRTNNKPASIITHNAFHEGKVNIFLLHIASIRNKMELQAA